ncbi:hypothetical protein K2O51_31100 (plasmid) [Cupriavidus pinatubonensis]|uniref:hypothetical protein n=1 Tax=Cupriavidus pinatubonensis TaxID=248026 RepID=UPI001C73CCA2|nr:hypothetical protein [Cupriavidus pinatubonensis]QYY33695.1 hypothetical protein K2O51_31100 [Cupriavidus pinatubonensis]
MKLAEAIERLERIHAHDRRDSLLVVPFDPGYATAGGRPYKPVEAINPGFDWDAGKVFIELDVKLMAPNEELERLTFRRYQNAMGRIGLALNSALPPEAKLQAVQSWVDLALGPRKVSAPRKA